MLTHLGCSQMIVSHVSRNAHQHFSRIIQNCWSNFTFYGLSGRLEEALYVITCVMMVIPLYLAYFSCKSNSTHVSYLITFFYVIHKCPWKENKKFILNMKDSKIPESRHLQICNYAHSGKCLKFRCVTGVNEENCWMSHCVERSKTLRHKNNV